VCNCSGYCAMWMKSPCYQCQTEVHPTRILPPLKKDERRSRNTHECAAPDCIGRLRHGHVVQAPIGHFRGLHPIGQPVGHRPNYIRGEQQHCTTELLLYCHLMEYHLEWKTTKTTQATITTTTTTTTTTEQQQQKDIKTGYQDTGIASMLVTHF